jgi:hypothetical protein
MRMAKTINALMMAPLKRFALKISKLNIITETILTLGSRWYVMASP